MVCVKMNFQQPLPCLIILPGNKMIIYMYVLLRCHKYFFITVGAYVHKQNCIGFVFISISL